MEVGKGWSFLAPSGPPPKKHLFFVLNNPVNPRQWDVVLASVSTLRRRADKTCILSPGDHSFISTQSFIEYASCRTESALHIGKMLKSGEWERKDDASSELLNRIIEGAFRSPHTKPRVFEFLEAE